jgi:hypothetical protein
MIAICVFVLLTVTCNIGPLTISLDKPFDSSQGKFGSIAFAEDVTDDGDPINPSTTFASDTEDVWALWTFTGIKSGTPWRREWKRDGKLITGVDETWEEDESGWIAYPLSDETGVEGGKYTFTLYIQGQRVQEASFTVGQRSPTTAQKMQRASFGSITLCEGATEDGKPIKPSNSFPAGATQVTALFMYTDLVPGQAWGRVWMKDGKEYISKRDEKWDQGDKGWRTLSLTDEDGIEGGHYVLILYIGDRMLQQSAFDVAAAPRKPASFGPITFAKDMTKDRQPVDAGTVFQQGIKRVIALFPYADMKNDQAWSREWIQDGQVLSNTGWKWGEQIDGTTYLDITGPNSGALAPGK